jgi:putative oxidoreductase
MAVGRQRLGFRPAHFSTTFRRFAVNDACAASSIAYKFGWISGGNSDNQSTACRWSRRRTGGTTMTNFESSSRNAQIAIAAARITMGICFIIFGLTKLLGIAGTIGLIGSKLPFPAFLFWLSICIEAGLGLCLVLGFKARYAASFLAFYCVFIAFVFHGVPTDRAQRDQALKNFVIAAGFITIAAAGPGAFALDNARQARVSATA